MGQTDIALNEQGIAQAHRAASLLAGVQFATIAVSPLKRTRETAAIINSVVGGKLLEIPDLIECSLGGYEGEVKGKWLDDWTAGLSIPGAESYQGFIHRACAGVNEALGHESPILIVSHGGVFWAIQKFAGLQHFNLENGSPVYLRPPVKPGFSWSLSYLDPDMEG
jgi:broad specificity phosphatase PhoE